MKTHICKKIQLLIMLLCFFSMGIGQLQAQKLFYQSSTGKMPLEVDKSSAIIQFKENTNIQTTLSSLKPSQSLNEVKGHPLNKRAILNFNENQNLTLSQLKDKYFANNNQVESMSYAYQLESGMQVWPTNQVILKLKVGASIASLTPLMERYQATYLNTNHEMVILKIADIQNAIVLSNLISESGFVEWANPDFFAELVHPDSPSSEVNEDDFFNDPLFPEQFQMHNTGQTIDGFVGMNDADCNALEAWGITTGSSDIIVAVIDDGVEAHEDLGSVLPGYTPARPGETGGPGNNPDNNEHGQACAGIIAASHNSIGVKGVAPNVNILPINIFTREETFSDIANAFYWATDNGADVISNSWGYSNSCTASDPSIDAAIAYAVTNGRGGKGTVVLFSSGNGYQSCVNYPAHNPNVIAVGAFGNTGAISSYSNQGTALDIVGPSSNQTTTAYTGARVRTIDRMGAAGYSAGNYTTGFGGTSASCPLVSGVAALVLSVNPDLTDAEVKNVLYTTATDMGTPGRDNTFGYGRVNAHAAVLAVMPEINLQGNGNDIAGDGSNVPNFIDGTSFLNSCAAITQTFTIQNTGTGILNLTGDPIVSISGSSDFTVSTPPAATTIAMNGALTFELTYTPITAGLQTATITIANNDSDEGTYTINVNGTKDTQAPLLSCPLDISETVASGETGKVITYDLPTVTDNCDASLGQLTEGLASGETFPIGTTTVTYQTTDIAGNIGECSFLVTIVEQAPICEVAIQSTTVNGESYLQSCEGSTDSFLLESIFTGNGTLSFQWQYLPSDFSTPWQNIAGATYSSLAVSPTAPGAYYYRIVVKSDNTTPDNLSDDCTAVSGTAATIIITPAPTVTFTAPEDLDEDAGLQTDLGGGLPTGGIYSGPGVTDNGNGLTYNFDPAAAGVDTHTITYTLTTNSCSGSASDDVEVFAVASNTPPVAVGGNIITVSVEENQTFAYDVDATDIEDDLAGIDLNYAISTTDGIDRNLFDIESNTGMVTFNVAPDFENPQDYGANNGYNIRVLITDSQGAQTLQNLTINVTDVDEIAPVITILGDNPLELDLGDAYVEFGATATDNVDADLTDSIIIDDSAVNTNIAGTYEVTYNVSDNAGNAALEDVRTVIVIKPSVEPEPCDTKVGLIENTVESNSGISPANPVYLGGGQSFITPAAVTEINGIEIAIAFATLEVEYTIDLYEGAATGALPETSLATATYVTPATGLEPISIGGTGFNFQFDNTVALTPGTSYYFIMTPVFGEATVNFPMVTTNPYADGKILFSYSNGTVGAPSSWSGWDLRFSLYECGSGEIDEINPEITLQGDNPLELNVGDAYLEPGATATDNVDGDLTDSIIIDASLVDTSIAGNYTVTYNVSDAAGNAATEVIRIVNVNAPSAITDNDPDESINLALLEEAILSGSVSNGRGTPEVILYDPLIDDYRTRTNWNEYGVGFGVNLGRPDADNGFKWQVDWPTTKAINYVTFGGVYYNQPQPNALWRISYLSNDQWMTLDEGQGGWIDSGIYEWDGTAAPAITADALRVQIYSDGETDLVSIHLRGRGGVSNYRNDSGTATKATLIMYLPPVGAPVADFSAVTNVLSVDFDASTSTDDVGVVNYQWNFGDGNTSNSGPTVMHTYAESGIYSVTLRVTDADGLVDVISKDVMVTDGTAINEPDENINLALLEDATVSGSVSDGRGTPETILYDPSIDDYFVRTNWNEYGVEFRENLGRPDADNGFLWQVDWTVPKAVNYITFGGTYSNQPQPNAMWRISYLNNSDEWITIEEGQGGWIDSGIYEWDGRYESAITAAALRVQVYSDGITDLVSIHLRARGGVSDYINDSGTDTKATLIQYLPEASEVPLRPENTTDLMKLSPNPTSGYTLLSFEVVTAIEFIEIHDLTGRLMSRVKGGEIDKKGKQISVQGLPNGIYTVKAMSTTGTLYQKKLIKI